MVQVKVAAPLNCKAKQGDCARDEQLWQPDACRVPARVIALEEPCCNVLAGRAGRTAYCAASSCMMRLREVKALSRTRQAIEGSICAYRRAVAAPIDLPHMPMVETPTLLRKCLTTHSTSNFS